MKKILKPIGQISSRAWLYLFIITALICIFSLRHNNQQMIKLRSAVYAADQNNGNINAALNNLRKYVYAHMNTNLSSGSHNIKPPIQLKYTYQRLYDVQLASQQAANQQIYSAAQVYCHNTVSQNSQTATNACIQNYAITHGITNGGINIPAGLYEFDFVSPTWSPDLAGWSLILTAFFGLAFLIKLGATRFRQ